MASDKGRPEGFETKEEIEARLKKYFREVYGKIYDGDRLTDIERERNYFMDINNMLLKLHTEAMNRPKPGIEPVPPFVPRLISKHKADAANWKPEYFVHQSAGVGRCLLGPGRLREALRELQALEFGEVEKPNASEPGNASGQEPLENLTEKQKRELIGAFWQEFRKATCEEKHPLRPTQERNLRDNLNEHFRTIIKSGDSTGSFYTGDLYVDFVVAYLSWGSSSHFLLHLKANYSNFQKIVDDTLKQDDPPKPAENEKSSDHL